MMHNCRESLQISQKSSFALSLFPPIICIRRESSENHQRIISESYWKPAAISFSSAAKRPKTHWDDQRVRDRTAYARPDQGKRPNYHSGGHKPRWLDEQTEIPEEEYKSYRTERRGRSQNDYRVFLPHRSPNCGMTTTFGDLCDFLCEPQRGGSPSSP